MIGILAEWAVRAALLAGVTAALLWLFRIRNVHIRLTVWTTVLAAILLMPAAPSIRVPVPDGQSPAPAVIPAVFPDTVAAQSVDTRSAGLDVALLAWLLPALFLLFRLAIGVRLSGRLARESRSVRDGVRESDRVRVPLTVGLLRPVVVLPIGWRGWSGERLAGVLAHERAHAARRDPLGQFLASLYCAACWFHPLAWWLKAHLAELAEAASDEAALAAGGDRAQYAETLLAFFGAGGGRVRYQGAAMATPRTRARRIDRVLDSSRKPAPPPRLAVAYGLVMGALALGLAIAAVRPVRAQAPAAPDPANLCGGIPAFRKWLNEDVPYIIRPEERRKYAALTAAPACEAFIGQFWKRRGQAAKEEHYRRIRYANGRFREDVPGWRTDRGRIYIEYGPPDGIDVAAASETWIYNGDKTFRFTGPDERGNYRLKKPE